MFALCREPSFPVGASRLFLLCLLLSSLAPAGLAQERRGEGALPDAVRTQDGMYLAGFVREIAGETINYHSPHPGAKDALLVRSEDSRNFIEWETATIPEGSASEWLTFVFIAAIDVNAADSHNFEMSIDGRKRFGFANPIGRPEADWSTQGDGGRLLYFKTTLVDRYDDALGYLFLKLPRGDCSPGRPVRIRVAGETAGSRSWFMVFKYSPDERVRFWAEQAVVRGESGLRQTIGVEVTHLGDPVTATVSAGGESERRELSFGVNIFQFPVPAVTEEEELRIEVTVPGRETREEKVVLGPVPYREVYLLPHSHVDIGYTHVQSEVERIQWDNLERAVEYARRTGDYPPGSRFKWNSEVIWAVESYLEQASPDKKEALIEAVRRGRIGLDALYANELTGLCRPEELMRLLEPALRVARECGVGLEAAMITDVPGYSRGLVTALAQHGVRYFSIGTNQGHRIGRVLAEWGDRPFYWVSASGEEKVLCWVAGKGYSLFHTGLGYTRLEKQLSEKPVLDYMAELAESGYPYEIVGLRYTIGSDNGPPDAQLADAVRQWNERYQSPRLVIATTAELFREFERRYGDSIPSVRGDFTGHWEDGAASSARETAINRATAERLVQAEILWSLLRPRDYPAERFYEAWRGVLLFDEHTWGSWNSISEPLSDFTLRQWETKQSFALAADAASKELLEEALGGVAAEGKADVIEVYNTCSWSRDDLVLIPAEAQLAGEAVRDEDGSPLPSQRLASGELAILVRAAPPLGSKRLRLEPGASGCQGHAVALPNGLRNELLSLEVCGETGAIRSLRSAELGRDLELVGTGAAYGLNAYLYVAGRKPDTPLGASKTTIEVVDRGPLVASLRVRSDAPGCRGLVREIRLVSGLERMDITDIIDKEAVYDPEGVHLAFPFNVPGGRVRMDLAWGFFRPECDQLPGACKNYFSLQRWVDVSNQDYGLTLASVDAPLFEIGAITADPIAVGWIERVEPKQALFAYVMNNYWETNYKAAQEGLAVFRFAIRPHRLFSAVEAERFGCERSRPLIAVPRRGRASPVPSLFTIEPAGVVATSLRPSGDGRALMLRLFNAGDRPEEAVLAWREGEHARQFRSSPFEEKGEEYEGVIPMPALAVRTLRVEF